MFRKILIIEDIDSINLGVTAVLQKQFSSEIRSARYCDEAYLMIKKAINEGKPFDLVITDLSFIEDHRETKIINGEMLIRVLRNEQPTLPVIVYSIEDRPYTIKVLLDNLGVNAFVAKGRDSSNQLIEAIHMLESGLSGYISPQVISQVREPLLFEIDTYDIELLKLLSQGLTKEEISEYLRVKGYHRSSVSSIEKRINKLKIQFRVQNTIHLVATAKDMGLI